MLLTACFHSASLNKQTQVNIIIPASKQQPAPRKTLWLLHGLTDDHSGWVRYTGIEKYAAAYNLNVVMPNVDRSWYTNTAYGANYFDFVAQELPAFCCKHFTEFSNAREENLVAGLSMGGYGALKLALTYPEQYSACISLSGSLDVTRKGRRYNFDEWRSIFGFEMASADELAGTPHDLFYLAEQAAKTDKALPALYLWCGTEDSLIEINGRFHDHLRALDIAHTYEYSEGDHSWKWWDKHIQSGLDVVLKRREEA